MQSAQIYILTIYESEEAILLIQRWVISSFKDSFSFSILVPQCSARESAIIISIAGFLLAWCKHPASFNKDLDNTS